MMVCAINASKSWHWISLAGVKTSRKLARSLDLGLPANDRKRLPRNLKLKGTVVVYGLIFFLTMGNTSVY